MTGVLEVVKILTIWTRREENTYSEFICGHDFYESSTVVCKQDDHDSIITFITKMPHLVAVRIPAFLNSKEGMTALKSCSKLEHLEFSQSWVTGITNIPKALRQKLTCLAVPSKMSYDPISTMTSLKHLSYQLKHHGQIPLEHLIALLNIGLVELETSIRYEHFDSVCVLGSRLESLEVRFYHDMMKITLSSNDVRQLVRSLPRIKKLNVDIALTSLAILGDLENLEDLTLPYVDSEGAEPFKSALNEFGHRLKSLRIVSVTDNGIIADIADTCPNLESFAVTFNYNRRSPSSLIPSFLRLTKLRFLSYSFRDWTPEEILELFVGLPNLRRVGGDAFMFQKQFDNFLTFVKKNLPKLDVVFIP